MLEILRKKIREHMNSYADEVAGGAAADFAKYREMVGVISGLALAERELVDLIERERRDDFED